ncbi:MAG: hypothetical protein HY042_11110 [Spirochaetia bacterium]|nr:hypothetical protein [Spirochaetia bacterium]
MPNNITKVIFAAVTVLTSGLAAQEKIKEWVSGYNSKETGLEESLETGRNETVYYLEQIERLRRAVPPTYVRIVNWREYGMGRGVLTKGILFTVQAYRSRIVYLSGDFNNWGKIPMYRNSQGVYYYLLPVREIEAGERILSYQYKYQIDGIWGHDPMNKNSLPDGLGGYLSEYRLNAEDVNRRVTVRVLKEESKGKERLVEFAVYLPEADNLSLVGSFNGWNPEHDLPVKGNDGIFRLRMRLAPGEYVYKYVADGRWMLDPFNRDTRFHKGISELCSYVKVE